MGYQMYQTDYCLKHLKLVVCVGLCEDPAGAAARDSREHSGPGLRRPQVDFFFLFFFLLIFLSIGLCSVLQFVIL